MRKDDMLVLEQFRTPVSSAVMEETIQDLSTSWGSLESLHWKVRQEAQGKTSNMKKELWEKDLKDAFHTEFRRRLRSNLKELPPLRLRKEELMGRWKKWKVKARIIPTNEPASRRVELLLAQIESEIAAVEIMLQAECASYDMVLSECCRGLLPQLTVEAWINAEAVNLMKAEEKCMQSLKDTFTKLELDLIATEKDSREKADEEAQVYAVVVSAVALLSLVYQYLAGYIDRGGRKTYSPGSLEFRSTYVSIVLFQGAYVWIKFRDPASRIRRGYCRPGQTEIEARYKPPRESGNDNYISLGRCATHEEAGIKKEIAAFYYGQHTGWLDFEDDHPFLIPSTPTEQEQARLSIKEKRKWVISKVMEVYEDVEKFRANIPTSTVHLGEQINACHHSSLPAEKFEFPASERPSVASDSENLPLSEDFHPDFCKFLEDFFQITPDLPDAGAQHMKDNHVQGLGSTMPMFDIQSDSSLDIEPPGTSYSAWGSESTMNVVHGSSEVAAGGLTNEGALHNPQAGSEFPPTMSPISTLQQHSDPMATLSDMVTPSVVHLFPGNSTSDQLASKVIRLLVQQIEEKDKRIEEHNKRIEEKDNRIAELEREVERLRGTSQY